MMKNAHPRPVYRKTYLKEWRKKRGVTQEQLAEAVGLSDAQINRIEKGKRQYTQAFLEAAAEYLETDPCSLLMCDPDQDGSIYAVWNELDDEQRGQALRILRALPSGKKEAV